MSFSNPKKSNPVETYFRWSGGVGEVSHWDKDKEENIVEKLPFTFIVLDEMSCMSGFNNADSSMFYSNEVRNTKKEPLIVRSKSGITQKGLYADLGDAKASGAKYAKSLYIAYKDGDEYKFGNIKMVGSSLRAWIEFSKSLDESKFAVSLVDTKEAKKGATNYFIPVFSKVPLKPEAIMYATKMDKTLQEFFATREMAFDSVEADDFEEDVVADVPEDDAELAEAINVLDF